ncbi:MAG: FHA domain-containing protein, partial [Polyangiales bacterium]
MLPLVVQIERSRGEPTVTRVFHQSPVHIGQSPHATLRLCEPHIAEWQASIHFDAERAVYRDLAARDARPADIEPHTPLEVELGRVRLRIQRRALLDDLTLDAPADPPTLVAPPQLTQPNPVFITTHRVVGATEHAERAAGTAHLLAYPAGAEHKPSARLMTGQQPPPYVVTPRRGIAERARAQTDPAREHEPSRSSEHACTAQAAACAPTSLVAVSHPRVIREACTVGGAPPTNARGTGPGPHPHDDPGWVDDTSPPSGPRAGTQRAAARRLAASEAAGPIDPTAAARHGTQWATPLQHAGHAPSWGEVGWAACASGTDERDVSRDQHAGTSWERAAAQQSGEVAWEHGASGCARSDAWDGGPLHARDERVARVSVAPERVIDRARWEDAM